MKRYWILLLFFFGGCAWLGHQIDYASICNADPACLADAKAKASLVGTIAGGVYPPLAGACTAFALTLALWFGGKKKKDG